MANIIASQESVLKNQRTAAAYKAEVQADEVYTKHLVNSKGEEVTNRFGHQVMVFIMTKNGLPVAQGIVSDKTALEGIDPGKAQVAESHYIDKKTGKPKVAMMMFNGIDILEGATLVKGL